MFQEFLNYIYTEQYLNNFRYDKESLTPSLHNELQCAEVSLIEADGYIQVHRKQEIPQGQAAE